MKDWSKAKLVFKLCNIEISEGEKGYGKYKGQLKILVRGGGEFKMNTFHGGGMAIFCKHTLKI